MAGQAISGNHVRLRPFTQEDLEFLCAVYASTRQEELAPVPWTAEEKDAFLRFQFQAQHKHYQEHYQGATFDVIEVEGVRAGRIYVHRNPTETRLMEISLLPEYRGLGIGSALIAGVLEEATRTTGRVTLFVEVINPVRRLYDRLGFRIIGETGVYLEMEWAAMAHPTS